MTGIYKITNPNGKVYIGQSVNIKKRKYKYKALLVEGQHGIYNSLKKYGWENHKFEILEICERKDLDKRERYYQEIYDSVDNGLNLYYQPVNGEKKQVSQETRDRMSAAWTDERKENFKKVDFKSYWTEEKRKKQSERSKRMGLIPPNQLGFKHSEQTKKQMSISRGKKIQNTSTKKVFVSIVEAMRYYKIKSVSSFYKKIRSGEFQYL